MTSFDNTHHDSLGVLVIPLSIGPVVFDVEFYIVDLEPSFSLLLGHPWLHKHQVIPLTLHRMIKFRYGDDIIIVVVENFDKEPVEVVSSVSQQTVQFDHKPSNDLYHANRFEPVNFILDLERVSSLAVHCNPSRMVENICRRWGYAKGTPLGRHGQQITEPIAAEERKDFEGLGYE